MKLLDPTDMTADGYQVHQAENEENGKKNLPRRYSLHPGRDENGFREPPTHRKEKASSLQIGKERPAVTTADSEPYRGLHSGLRSGLRPGIAPHKRGT
jgi:hypothetical protein